MKDFLKSSIGIFCVFVFLWLLALVLLLFR